MSQLIAEPVASSTTTPVSVDNTLQNNDLPPLDVLLSPSDTFARRHIGPSDSQIQDMLKAISADSLDDLVKQTVPKAIALKKPLKTGKPRAEHELLLELKKIASKNKVFRSLIGRGYHGTITPPVIQRNILENPGWYTQYTPYQAEISQGRMEALLNFQTMIASLTGLPLANSSLLDEGTACAEAMAMARSITDNDAKTTFFVDERCHPQTIAVVKTRAWSMGITCVVGPHKTLSSFENVFGVLVQYPTTDGLVEDYASLAEKVHANHAMLVVAADVLSLAMLKPPGEFGADIAVGSTQRFGVPMGFGGPHAAYLATRESYARKMPGRIIGVSKDSHNNPALRLTLQTREQHIRRDKATSNICTAQVLLAIMASMYGVYHGPSGIRRIAARANAFSRLFAGIATALGHSLVHETFFDTLRIKLSGVTAEQIHARAAKAKINLRDYYDGTVGLSFDELTNDAEIELLAKIFNISTTEVSGGGMGIKDLIARQKSSLVTALASPSDASRTSPILDHPIFSQHHSEHQLTRYINQLQSKDLSLVHSMIALGSCTMKLNATSEMLPVTWAEFGNMHPFAPANQSGGYQKLFSDLEKWLCEITGFAGCWLQPNAGSQGEYAGLLMIRAYHESRNEPNRTICLIPESAHGTNPASAIIAGFSVVPVGCLDNGDIDLADLSAKAELHKDNLAAVMITYPSTHGVFEATIKEACDVIHKFGGQVYMDGANMNAQVGLCRPGDFGADVCHLNLHKTFCIPHGGGGPGMGPICMAPQLAKFIPKQTKSAEANTDQLAVSAAPYGSPSILTIPWVYIALMGGVGLKRATQVAILNANYMAHRLEDHFPILFAGQNGRVAHEFVIDCRGFEKTSGVKVEDIAKRLIDYGFHAPTMSWPVPGTLMIEPTESEDQAELDRFCDAMISIRSEITQIEQGTLDRVDNPLKHAPHTATSVASDAWSHKYSRDVAAYPLAWVRARKFWPTVGRVDNVYGDRNLVCSCPPMSDFK